MVWGSSVPVDSTKTQQFEKVTATPLEGLGAITDEVLATHTAAGQAKAHGSHRRPPLRKRLPAVPWAHVVVAGSAAVAAGSVLVAVLLVLGSDDAPVVRQSQPSPSVSPSRVVAPVSTRPSVSHRPSTVPQRPVEPVSKPLPAETWTVRPKPSPTTSAPSPTVSASASPTATPKPTVTKTATPTVTAEPTVDSTPESPSPTDTTEDDDADRPYPTPWWATPTGENS